MCWGWGRLCWWPCPSGQWKATQEELRAAGDSLSPVRPQPWPSRLPSHIQGRNRMLGLLAGDWLVASSRHGLQESWPQWANGRDRACPPGWWTQLSQVLGEGSLLPVPYIVSFLSFFSHFKTIIFTVFERQGDRDAGSSLILQQPRLDQANAKSLKLHPGLPRGWWELSTCAVTWEQRAESQSESCGLSQASSVGRQLRS